MAISAVGTAQTATGSPASTVSVSVTNAGDLCVVGALSTVPSISPTSASGTNSMGTFSSTAAISDAGVGAAMRLFYATAGASGTSTVTISWSSAIGTTFTEIAAQMFTAGFGTSTMWALDGTQIGTLLTTSSTTVLFPSLTATGTGELYFGFAVCTGTGSAGATSGFTYQSPSGNILAYKPSGSGTLNPTGVNSTATNSIAAAILMTASASLPPVIVAPSVAAMQASIW